MNPCARVWKKKLAAAMYSATKKRLAGMIIVAFGANCFFVLVLYTKAHEQVMTFIWAQTHQQQQQLEHASQGLTEQHAIPGFRQFPTPLQAPRQVPCPDRPAHLLGAMNVSFVKTPQSLEAIEKSNPDVELGGQFRPSNCIPSQKVAIIVPFRHRDDHLKHWLYYLHPILQRQRVEYGVYIINQFGEGLFNRAKLMNIGYVEALKDAPYDCFIFSDVDLVPMDDRNLYRCYDNPRHFSVAVDKFNFSLPYKECFGGVSGLTKKQFEKINGFPNNYWGWGGEDDDIYNRIIKVGMNISRPDMTIGRYRMIRHDRDAHNENNPFRSWQITKTAFTMWRDGINTLEYKLVKAERWHLYTKVIVEVGKRSPGNQVWGHRNKRQRH
ncbi:beta-1,4-galactosyltransferase 2-like isoform X1 [Lethenteron reissneri]|uniref:beta-1,4-galactosyltransferase 2-like isoform X1 n=2 Tax=Lethenteron reissneri TaxID=7753 RepID=UPI002AB7B007|nr:beta-1,4-galactosyltransferase 2-like isoform X1 [Lethenteron reissneri]